MASKKKTRNTVAKVVYLEIAKQHGCKPSEVLTGEGAPRAQLWKSCHDDNWTLTEIAEAFDSTAPTVLRNLQRYYPKEYPGRAA